MSLNNGPRWSAAAKGNEEIYNLDFSLSNIFYHEYLWRKNFQKVVSTVFSKI